ncbi:MAG: M28 family peptidase [Candidatus Neomarinimicrobiota bacterium]
MSRTHQNFRTGLIVFAGLLTLAGCRRGVPNFDGERAFAQLERQCAFGPRNPGSTGYLACRAYLLEQLTVLADTVITQPFELTDPVTGEQHALTNIIGQFNRPAQRRILLGAHWDTRPWADRDPDPARRGEPIIGANDGASGVAVLLEVARILADRPPVMGVDIVFFDGEDLGENGDPASFARGSRFFARNLPLPHPAEAIVLDMIGDRELTIPVERYSHNHNPELVRKLWETARRLKLPAFQNRLGPVVYDDHVPLWEEAKIPAVDLIDFDYPNQFDNYWHTHSDLPRHCSAASLEQVGTLLIHHIYREEP